ncbi:hypothetical protein L6452_20113 [Arctium lappa]|uniref:Uncharacterized protein n=1 Tax=Arctium lappa TaxID=4217 RepID=A0ACB9BAV5_ARCLA|nr:hypothetical protein L6452_20113 [Arctium lappa]
MWGVVDSYGDPIVEPSMVIKPGERYNQESPGALPPERCSRDSPKKGTNPEVYPGRNLTWELNWEGADPGVKPGRPQPGSRPRATPPGVTQDREQPGGIGTRYNRELPGTPFESGHVWSSVCVSASAAQRSKSLWGVVDSDGDPIAELSMVIKPGERYNQESPGALPSGRCNRDSPRKGSNPGVHPGRNLTRELNREGVDRESSREGPNPGAG